jgi:hypothetical protein
MQKKTNNSTVNTYVMASILASKGAAPIATIVQLLVLLKKNAVVSTCLKEYSKLFLALTNHALIVHYVIELVLDALTNVLSDDKIKMLALMLHLLQSTWKHISPV